MRSVLFAFFLATSVIATASNPLRADDNRRYYEDRDHHDRHEWNEGEARAWRHWITDEHHAKYHDWDRASDRERREYWRWRHEHADWR